MVVRLSYIEVKHYILSHFNKDIEIRRVSDNTVSVGTTLKVAFISQPVGLNVTVDDIRGEDVFLSHNNGFGIDLMLRGFMKFILSVKSELGDAIEVGSSNTIILHLGRIKQLEKVFESVEIKSISFAPNDIVVNALLI
jgi:hypothetical protein